VQFPRFIRRNWKSVVVLIVGVPIVAAVGVYRFDNMGTSDKPTEVLGQTIAADAASTTTTEVTLEFRTYKAGDCVKWDQGERAVNRQRPTQVVPCDQDHLFEYVSKLEFQQDGDYPTDDEWNSIISANCTVPVTGYLGYALDSNGKFAPGAIHPSTGDWWQHDRTLLCGIQERSGSVASGDRDLPLFKGAVKGQDQTYLLPSGHCYGQTDSYAVDCTQAHDYEVVGSTEVKTKSRPSTASGWQSATSACQAQARTYANGTFKTARNGAGWRSSSRVGMPARVPPIASSENGTPRETLCSSRDRPSKAYE